MTTYEQVHKLSRWRLQRFETDLEKWDREIIEKHPGVPFLHFTRDMGTHIAMLYPADEYPPRGERVPYLFGTADRDHILDQVIGMVQHFIDSCNPPARLVLYFDGSRVREISVSRAMEIARDYVRRIRYEWQHGAVPVSVTGNMSYAASVSGVS